MPSEVAKGATRAETIYRGHQITQVGDVFLLNVNSFSSSFPSLHEAHKYLDRLPEVRIDLAKEGQLWAELARLYKQDYDLDVTIATFQDSPSFDLMVQRLKKRKLQFRHRVTFIQDQLSNRNTGDVSVGISAVG